MERVAVRGAESPAGLVRIDASSHEAPVAPGIQVGAHVLLGGLPPSILNLAIFIAHLTCSALLGLLGALMFAQAAATPGWASSLLMNLLQHGVQGLAHVMLPGVPSLVVAMLPLPGVLLLSWGLTGVAAFVTLHLLYAAFIGELYLPALKPRLLDPRPLLPVDRDVIPLG